MRKITIINDDADFLQAMELLLEQLGGYEAVMIHEGSTAYHLVKKEKPDLIILDIRLEHPVSGWKVLDLLTLDPETSKIPVIICTASMDEITPEKEEWLQLHGINVLPKPFDVDDLIAMVESMFMKKKKKNFLQESN